MPPVSVNYPGVYIEEVDSGVRTIAGVPTSITAFVGRARRGPVDEPVLVHGLGEFTRRFGGLWADAPLGHAVSQYYANGGAEAVIVRVYVPPGGSNGLAHAQLAAGGATDLDLRAANPGSWGNRLFITVEEDAAADVFHLTIEERAPGPAGPPLPPVVASERFVRLSHRSDDPRFITDVLAAESRLVRVETAPSGRVAATADAQLAGGDDGGAVGFGQIADATALEGGKKGMWALEKTDLFNLLVIPPFEPATPPDKATWDAAATYAEDRRAVLLVDPDPTWDEPGDITAANALTNHVTRTANAALYFPRIEFPDPLQENRSRAFPPSGAVAGIIARTDGDRGIWKAPAGQEATIAGATRLAVSLTDAENGVLNPLAVNCLRTFPTAGTVVWGARTLRGADALADQWKYLPVRRTALYIEESLYRGTQWVVFEPNDEPLWAQIRLSVGSFMNGLFRQGAFQGTTPAQAYFVRCDRDTNPQEDIDRGIVNIFVGFAPLKPAEFVIISIQQIRPAE